MNKLILGEREIPLTLTALETATIQEELGCTVLQLRDDVLGCETNFEELDKDGNPKVTLKILSEPQRVKKLGTVIRILGNAGLEMEGKEPDLTDKWVLRNMKPAQHMILAYAIAVQAVINEAMAIELPKEENGPVDLILEEENRKKEPGN